MPRLARIVAPGLPHHVTQRGNRRQRTFFEDTDFRIYKIILAEQAARFAVEVWAWCLMPNHVHLVLVPSDATGLTNCLRETHRRYTLHINRRMGWCGYLWQGRFASCVLDEPHLIAAARYIEWNPVRAALCAMPVDWPWSSARAHLHDRPDGLTHRDALLGIVPDWHNLLASDEDADAADRLRRSIRTGRPVGSDEFEKSLEVSLGRQLRRKRPGRKPKVTTAPAAI